MVNSKPGCRSCRRDAILVGMVAFATIVFAAPQLDPPWLSGIQWPRPEVVDPGPVGGPPSDAIVLFDGKDLSEWAGEVDKWKLQDGYGIAGGTITTRRAFGDCQLHIEWAAPTEIKGDGQNRGNSGVKLMGCYEVQILDSYDNETYYDGQAGAIYKQRPPLVNACRKPGEWQTYDIIFRAPRFDQTGKLLRPAFITVLHNGVLIQDHFELLGQTAYRKPPMYLPHPAKQPLLLAYHRHPVRFRNIWIRELGDTREDLVKPLREKLAKSASSRPG
ncbi:MAG TPA: DUF1080 domain-containing protein [Phycisphaerae bacterium]|jgi:hypothetical protein|nr:DUF1080 domain-containing protein [Phycisphaerae bacterium]HOJ54146.1 DUF1080 domain-containing protein [Phycisphaerae bacterium]HOL25561.1 DUF1080 domain-containing protein [Phycisphaerae bacterium]HPP21006.1 DUF1080 domain-containing protein [Phycisphaerae bacterium]HPU31905.1 DUF1080 domain-containing protein [Phycisphaerae bacterium]